MSLTMDRTQSLHNEFDDPYNPIKCNVTLKNKELWNKFHELGTEMIITKSGRRMFPSLHVQISNLDPHAHYCVMMEMSLASRCRYKYSASIGWAPASTEETQSPHRMYLHPESPASGEYWMSQAVSFGRLKLTNTPSPPSGQVVLTSMHKYQPRIIIVKTSDPRAIRWSPSKSFSFPETEFIAVTAYQNEKITKLKIDNNPFAKGFRENGHSKLKKKRSGEESESKRRKSESEEEIEIVKLDDRSSSGSPDSVPERSFSPEIKMEEKLPTPNFYNYYYYNQYYGYGYYPNYYYHQFRVQHSPGYVEDLSVQQVEKPKKLTDFSIKAICGLS